MRNLSFKRHRFPAEVITSSIWLYARFTLSLRDVEEMFAERGLDVSYETVRRWFLKFGPVIAAKLKRARPKPSDHWHLDEMAVVIRGQRYWLWRAVDNEGEVLDFIVQRSRDAKVAAKLMKKLLKRYEIRPSRIVTDELRSYRARVATSASPPSMTRACEPTIAPKTPTCTVRETRLENSSRSSHPRRMKKLSPFRYFKTSPEVIRLAVMMYVRFPLSLRNVEDLLEAVVTKRRNKSAALKLLRKLMKRYGPPQKLVTDRLPSYQAALRELGGTDLQVTGRWLNNRIENSHLPFRRRERAMLRFRRMRSLQKFAAVHASVHNFFNQERHLSSRNIFKLNRTAALDEWRQICAA